MTILVTGGAGFIGSNFVLDWMQNSDECVINLDKLTYAGNLNNIKTLMDNQKHIFVEGDIQNYDLVLSLLTKYHVNAIVHFAAESHVDRSINDPEEFINTNVIGTFRLLQATRHYLSGLDEHKKQQFRFLHVSTDEVFGSLGAEDPAFTELSQYEPNSPYSASKASADHFVRAYHHTYGLPVITTNCSNNYGPYQFPEKLIPLSLCNALSGKPIALYGNGQQIRDWLYVKDHCSAIRLVLEKGRIGEVYAIGGCNNQTNQSIVETICGLLDQKKPREDGHSYSEQITYVTDRPGHDTRYAIDISKIKKELGWKPSVDFEVGIEKTIDWYLDNQDWVTDILNGTYRNTPKENL